MTLVCKTLACLSWLLAASVCSWCAPAGLVDDACADVQRNSLLLNQLAKNASLQARNGSKDVSSFLFTPDWIEAKDKCDPKTLSEDSTPCVEKIAKVLSSHRSALKTVTGFINCSKAAAQVKPALDGLHKSMSRCVPLKEDVGSETKESKLEDWKTDPFCHYTLDRLVSFSVLTARVFAAGHPTRHAQASSNKCM